MILYLDTSSLVKLYVAEKDSEVVTSLVARATFVVTSRITCPEFYSALTRRRNSREINKQDYERLCAIFSEDWERITVFDFDEIEAGRLVRKHGLRGADAIHLATVMQLAGTNEELELVFSSGDGKLNLAAQAEGLALTVVESELH